MRPVVTIQSPPSGRGGGAAFTLIEILLAITVLLVLLAALVINIGGWGKSRKLLEGADRFETVIYMARADAARLGKKLRLSFTGDQESDELENGGITLLLETDPLSAPGQFSEYAGCTWLHQLPTGMVQVNGCRLLGSSVYSRAEWTDDDDDEISPLTFYPDGSCDSAEIELASTDPADTRVMIIEVDGITGRVTSQLYEADNLPD